jgi:hypothetical protein
MGYIVEIVVAEDCLREQMNEMRAWLDHQRFAPSRFQVSDAAQSTSCRIYFKAGDEAAAFARQFGGHLLSTPATDAVVA